MKNTDTPEAFCVRFDACIEGRKFALQYATMAEVWDNCPRPDWLIWIMDRLQKPQDDKKNRLFACWCVEFTPLPDGRTTWDLLTDERSRNAVRVALRFARDEANQEELAAARDAAWAAAWAAARDAAWAAAWAAAGDAAWAAARDAARDAAGDAAGAAARAAAWDAARDAAGDAAGAAAWAAARAAQANHFRTLFPNPFKETQ
jgi:hypothetical protein